MEKHSQEEAQHGESQKGEDERWRRAEREKVRREKMQVREKGRKVATTVCPMFCGSGGSKSRLAKAAGAEPAGQMARSRVGSKE